MVLPPRRLIASFLLVLLLPASVVVWLGIRLVEQDRTLEVRQLRERRESACDRIVARLEQQLSATENNLAGDSRASLVRRDDDALVFIFDTAAIESFPKGGLLYGQSAEHCEPEPSAPFAAAEDLEFRSQDYLKAADALRPLTASADSGVRAGALLRLARTLRKAGRSSDALKALGALEQVTNACVAGLPADLGGRPRQGRPARRKWPLRRPARGSSHSTGRVAARTLAHRSGDLAAVRVTA